MNTNSSVTIVGAGGTMAGHYIPKIVTIMSQLGVSNPSLVLVESDSAKCEALKVKFPGSEIATSVRAVSPSGGCVAFVLSNTPAHCQNILDLIDRGYTSIFVEKPTVMNDQEMHMIKQTLAAVECSSAQVPRIFTAYLMKFSGAANKLKHITRQQKLLPAEIDIEWGKNRTMDKRPTAGNAVDEAVHGWGIALDLINDCRPKNAKRILRSCNIGQQNFFNREVQMAANMADPSFPLDPPSSTKMMLDVAFDPTYGDGYAHHNVVVSLRSSFTRISQERVVRGVYSGALFSSPYMFEIRFDQKDEQGTYDILTMQKAGDKDVLICEKFYEDKLLMETGAFLSTAFLGQYDFRLTELNGAHEIQSLFQECLTKDTSNEGVQTRISS